MYGLDVWTVFSVNLEVFGEDGQKGALLNNTAKFEMIDGIFVARFLPPVVNRKCFAAKFN